MLKAAKTLQQFNEENSTLYTVSEDFSINTKNIRNGLQDHVKPLKKLLGARAQAVFVRYKSLVVLDSKGKYRTFTAEALKDIQDEFPDEWWVNLVTPLRGKGKGGGLG